MQYALDGESLRISSCGQQQPCQPPRNHQQTQGSGRRGAPDPQRLRPITQVETLCVPLHCKVLRNARCNHSSYATNEHSRVDHRHSYYQTAATRPQPHALHTTKQTRCPCEVISCKRPPATDPHHVPLLARNGVRAPRVTCVHTSLCLPLVPRLAVPHDVC